MLSCDHNYRGPRSGNGHAVSLSLFIFFFSLVQTVARSKAAQSLNKSISEDTQEMRQSRITALPKHQQEER